jgi:hypothetical protein
MPPTIVGEPLLATDAEGRLKSRIATIFPQHNTIINLPGIHATQRLAMADLMDQERREKNLPPLTEEERTAVWADSVDLVMEEKTVLIRPDPDNMPLAFWADEILQELYPKRQVKFLYVVNSKVRSAIKRRGECWRITPLSQSPDEMKQMILGSRIAIGGKALYYYNRAVGTRFVTYQEFRDLAKLDEAELRKHLVELRTYSTRTNRLGCPEIAFFEAGKALGKTVWAPYDFTQMDEPALRVAHETLRQTFQHAVRVPLQEDDVENVEWRNAMFAALMSQADQSVPEETLLGLSSEFYMQIEWLPGVRIEQGELIFDSVFEEPLEILGGPEMQRQWLEKSRGFVFNLVRDYGDLEYVNIGRVMGSLSKRPAYQGRRDVYIVELKQRGSDREVIRIIRMQKWGVREHLDEGKGLLEAMLQSESYTEYILDRRLACRQLGMNLSPRISARKLSEMYHGKGAFRGGYIIRSTYFERDYLYGIATDKLSVHRWKNPEYAVRFARLLGRAAAPNIIVGRCDDNGRVVFDDGDEVVLEDEQGMPAEIVVADHTSTFADCTNSLRRFAGEYATPMNRRAPYVAEPEPFFAAYLEGFLERFCQLQAEYRRRKRAFDNLFQHLPKEPAGSFASRWAKVLERLYWTDPEELQQLIRRKLVPPARQ